MTDAEVICGFMEPKPGVIEARVISKGGWWKSRWSSMQYRIWPYDDKTDSLDAMHEVEAKLTDEQWIRYRREFRVISPPRESHEECLIHLTAEQKIKALAAVLRGSQC